MIGIMVDLCDPDLDSKPSDRASESPSGSRKTANPDRGPSDLGTWEALWIQTIQSKLMAS